MKVTKQHYEEWTIGSGVHPDLVRLNVRSLSGDEAYSELLYSEKVPRRNDGRLRDGVLKQYAHLEAGGWWCSGIDILTGEDDPWGCFKPNHPRLSQEGKPIKYEHPYRSPTGIFCHKVPWSVGLVIAKVHGLQKQYAARILKAATEPFESKHLRKFFNKRNQKRDLTAPQEADLLKLSHLSHEDPDFWQWVLNHPEIPVVITEGAKKAGGLLTCGWVAIALPGIYNGYRTPKDVLGTKIGKPHLIPQLEPFADGRKIIFGFDQDEKPTTLMNVRKAIYTTAQLFLAASQCECQVAQWSGAKGIDDLKVTQGEAAVKNAIASALDFFGFLADGVRQLTYPVTQTIDPSLRYLPYLNLEQAGKVIALKAPKGKGKTHAVGQALKGMELPCLILGHRNHLLDQLAQRYNIVSNGDLRSPESQDILIERLCAKLGIQDLQSLDLPSLTQPQQLSLLDEEDKPNLYPTLDELINKGCETAGINSLNGLRDRLGFALCCDSLHEKAQAGFRPEQWGNCILFIDEIEQVLWHCVNGKTAIKKHRVKILQILQELVLQVYHSPKGRIIVADADLSDLTIEWLQRILGQKVDIHLIEQKCELSEPEKWDIYWYDHSTPYQLLADLKEAIARGEKPFISVSGQDTASITGTVNLEHQFTQYFPHLKILRLDSESLRDPSHPAFGAISHLNEILGGYDVVIASPAIETGVSIDLKGHFTSVWGIAGGVTTDNSAVQTLHRIRENVPRHLWVAPVGLNKIGNGGITEKELLESKNSIQNILAELLKSDSWDLEGIAFYDEYKSDSAVWYPLWLKFAKRYNFVMQNYRRCIKNLLMREGHHFHPWEEKSDDGGDAESIKGDLKESRSSNYERQCVAVSQIERPNPQEMKELSHILTPTASEKLKLKKGQLCDRFHTEEVTPEMVDFYNKGGYAALRLRYFLTAGRSFLERRDKAVLERHLLEGGGQLWFPDLDYRFMRDKVEILEVITLPTLLCKETFSNLDSDLIYFKEQCLALKGHIRKSFGILIDEKNAPLTILKRFLRCLGWQGVIFEYLGRLGPREDRSRVYRLIKSEWQEKTLQAWFEDDSQKEMRTVIEQSQGILDSLIESARCFVTGEKMANYWGKVESFVTHHLDEILKGLPDFVEQFSEVFFNLCPVF